VIEQRLGRSASARPLNHLFERALAFGREPRDGALDLAEARPTDRDSIQWQDSAMDHRELISFSSSQEVARQCTTSARPRALGVKPGNSTDYSRRSALRKWLPKCGDRRERSRSGGN